MLVTFLNVPSHTNVIMTVYPPVGILLMSANLKISGYKTAFIDADVQRLSPLDVARSLKDNPPSILGITLNVAQVKHAVSYIRTIQQAFPSIPIVLGGPYVTAVGENIYCDFPSVPYAIAGEGEYAIIDLCEYLNGKRRISQVRNLIGKNTNTIDSNCRHRIDNIDQLPLPDYSLVQDTISLYQGPYPTIATPSIAIMCARGCPFSCSFCSSPVTWGRRMTFRSVNSVVREIEYLKTTIGVREIFFQDDTLNTNKKWFVNLCDAIINKNLHHDIIFKAPFRVDRKILTEEILKKAKQANFGMIFYGVENGNQQMLDRMHKQTNIDDIKRAFLLTRKVGIASYGSFMIGNDGETFESVQDSIKLAEEIVPDFGGFAVAAPFPGTELYRTALRKGHITTTDFREYQFGDCILSTDELSIEQIVSLTADANSRLSKIRDTARYKKERKKIIFSQINALYPEEQWDVPVRRSGRRGYMVLPVSHSAIEAQIEYCADYPDINQNPVKLVFILDTQRYRVIISTDEWQKIVFPLPRQRTYPVVLQWTVNRTWNPRKTGLNPADDRELGITIKALSLQTSTTTKSGKTDRVLVVTDTPHLI